MTKWIFWFSRAGGLEERQLVNTHAKRPRTHCLILSHGMCHAFSSFCTCTSELVFSASNAFIFKLWLQWSGYLMRRANSLEKTLMLEKIEGKRRRGREMMRWLDDISGHKFEQTLGDSEGQRSQVCCSSWGHKELDTTERLNNNNLLCQAQKLKRICPISKRGFGLVSTVNEHWHCMLTTEMRIKIIVAVVNG